jgi:hypothetical protein
MTSLISSNLAQLPALMRTVDAERANLLLQNAVARLEQSSHVDLADVHAGLVCRFSVELASKQR